MVLPLLIAAVGVIANSVRSSYAPQGGNPQRALNIGTFGAGGMIVVFILLMVWIRTTLADGTNKFQYRYDRHRTRGIVIGQITEYYQYQQAVINAIVKSCDSGPATTITQVSASACSTFPTVVIIAAGIFVA